MMAESLPFSVGSPVPTWELEAWYEDLEEVLSLDVSSRIEPPVAEGQELEEFGLDDTTLLWYLDASDPLEASGGSRAMEHGDPSPHLTVDLLDLFSKEPAGPPDSDSSCSSPPQTTGTDEEEAVTSRKRKQRGQPQGSKRRRRGGREREQQNERRVAELTAQNEHLQQEIERLSAEVEATRAALIQRMVNLKS